MAGLSGSQREALDRLREELQQGDVVHVDAFAVVGAPEATTLEDTRDAEEFARYRLTAVERRLQSGLWAVITQTCDIRRDLDLEPFVHLSPIIGVDEPTWRDLLGGSASVRRFAYPAAAGGVEHPVLDIRIVQTVEKTALLAENVEPQPSGLDQAMRFRLSTWLSRRFARHAFPDELEELVLGRLRTELRKRRGQTGSPAGALLDCREAVMVTHGDGPVIDVLFLVRQDRVAAHPVFAADAERRLKEGADAIMRPIAKRLESQGSGYQLTWGVATPNTVPFSEILYRYVPFDVDVP